MSPHAALSMPALAVLAIAACDRAPVVPDAVAEVGRPIGPIPGPADRPPGPTNPYLDDDAALREGRRLFVQFNCSGCHGDHAGGGMGPSLRDAAWIYGGEDADVFDSIAAGRARGMPAYGSLLPAQSIWQVVTYIGTLGTPGEHDPPR
jgi:cytochrome c oxidase cbb3-type subunit III